MPLQHHQPGCGRMMIDGKSFREVEANLWDPQTRLRECDCNGVTVQVLSTVPARFTARSEGSRMAFGCSPISARLRTASLLALVVDDSIWIHSCTMQKFLNISLPWLVRSDLHWARTIPFRWTCASPEGSSHRCRSCMTKTESVCSVKRPRNGWA